MRTIVIMPGGFHPFHAGHAALYKSAVKTFNNADVYVAATNDTKTRPFPFAIKEKLAKLAGVADKHFVQVKSPFQAKEITQHYNPDEDVLIFVRSEKDKNEQPKPGGVKKDGSPAYFQPWTGKNLQPFSKHAYIAYLPTVEFGPGITSATEIRNAWPTLNDKRKTAMVMSLYPATQKNPKLAANVVKMLDLGMGNELDEDISRRGFLKGMGAAAVAGGANAGQYQSSNELSSDQLQQIWKPRKAELEARCYAILKSFANSSLESHPDWTKVIQNIKVEVTIGDSRFRQGNAARTNVQIKTQNGKFMGIHSNQIILEATVFWDAPNSTLAFILGHECGHLIMNHAISPSDKGKDNEVEADLIGAQLAKKIGYDRASFFKFLFNAKAEQLRNGSPNDPHLEPIDRVKMLKQKADFELSKNSVEYIDSLAQQLRQGVAETIKRVEPISKSVPIQQTVIHPVKQDVYIAPEKKTTPAVVNHIKPREVKEFAPPSSDDGGGDNRSRRIRKLLEIAIQVAKEKNIDELGMIHGMNMIAGDEFFNTAVEGILPDITDKEYMFVLQSAYKTVKQGLAEAKKKRKKKSRKRSLGRYFFPGYGYYGGSGESGEGGGDGGGEGVAEGLPQTLRKVVPGYAKREIDKKMDAGKFGKTDADKDANFQRYKKIQDKIKEQGVAEGDVVPFKQPSKTLTWQQVPRDVLLLANDWFWASEDNSGLDATIDPEGFGNGTANDVKYLTAKLQQKGWTIDYNDENDGIDEYNLILTNKRGQKVLLSINDAQSFTGWASGTNPVNEGPFVQRITNPKKVSIYLRIGKGSKLVATDIPYEILDKYITKVIQKYPQFKPTDFSFKSSDKVDENLGIPYPTTYEQENNKFKRRGPMRITAMTEFAPPGSDDREPDEEEILRQLAAQWWNGSMQQMKKAQQTLQAMGWEIGQDESGDEDAGVFVIRIGDENGDSYIAFPHSELGLNEDYLNEK